MRESLIVATLSVGFAAAGWLGWAAQTTVSVTRSTLIRMDVPTLARNADFVIYGEVTAQQPTVQGNIVFTQSTIRVRERLRGSSPSEFALLTRGGSIRGLVAIDQDDAKVPSAGEVVLFVVRNASGEWVALGGFQGRYYVSATVASNERETMPLDELRRRIAAAGP
jgi:hypothetical protein